ncbi:PCS3 [Symbiodinium pilosum]|uniref:PCS3 protein n=1 Tax=Symbiodinium pilosum TaxID=2952 RepID=A0A812VWT0_SYMPI|nr:PCS3 [Symbiodinium pilosum]
MPWAELGVSRGEARGEGRHVPLEFLPHCTALDTDSFVLLSAVALTFSGYGMCGWNWHAYGIMVKHSLTLFIFDCAAQLFAVTFQQPLLGLFQVICLWFASFLFAGVLVPEEDVVWPLRAFAIVSPMKWSIKAIVNAEMYGTTFDGAVLDNSTRGFSRPGVSELECWGVTGEQVLTSISLSIAKNVTPQRELGHDCSILVAIAALFRFAYSSMAALRCRTGKAVKKPKEMSSPKLTPQR